MLDAQLNLFEIEPPRSPENVRHRKIIVGGREFESLESAANTFQMSRNTVDYRISRGWTPNQALGLEPRPSFAAKTPGIPIKVQGREFKNIKEAAKYYGRSYTHIFERLKHGCTIEEALGLIKKPNILAIKNPNLAKQWHPTKNTPLTPENVTTGSGEKVWWLCRKGHEWEAVINSRNRGMGCPFCAGQRPTTNRNFASSYPELLKEWDWKKNGDIRPETLSPRSQQNVWWKCEKGHPFWQATLCNRTRVQSKGSCPYCLNRLLCEDNSLARVRPDVAQDWHPTKNGRLTPKDVVAGGYQKVWWICKHNHEWQATVGSRVHSGTGCPKCKLQTSRIEIAVYSEISALFSSVSWQEKIGDYQCDIFLKNKNIGIEVDGVYWHRRRPNADTAKSKLFNEKGIQLFRLREEGLGLLSERDVSFKWSANMFPIISKLVNQLLKYASLSEKERSMLQKYVDGSELINEAFYRKVVSYLPAPPPGQSLADKRPDIAKQWAYDLNVPLTPEHFRPAASKNVWWRCEEGHVWRTSLCNRATQNNGCPKCPRPTRTKATVDWNLAAVRPDLAKEWNYKKNGNTIPKDITPNSNRKFWWTCSKDETHEWQAQPSCRNRGAGCPFCYGRFASKTNNLQQRHPEVLKEWDYELNKGVDPTNLTPYSNRKAWWRCAMEGHSWQAPIYNRTKMKSGCPDCARKKSRRHSIEFFQEFANKRGGKCLSEEFVSSRKKIKMRCNKGHIWEARADGIIYQNKWCLICSRNNPRMRSLSGASKRSHIM